MIFSEPAFKFSRGCADTRVTLSITMSLEEWKNIGRGLAVAREYDTWPKKERMLERLSHAIGTMVDIADDFEIPVSVSLFD